ncbi:MAG: pyridoxine 5'-phosphate synthase [bacterium]|nr:pyridoxine 5'-phosphate synthase [bacterium]
MSLSQEKPPHLRLGVNIDHVATIRNARGGGHPDPLKAAILAIDAGADGITAHLREDRRHISDEDIEKLRSQIPSPLNLEMAATIEMLGIAVQCKPHACCLVPEKRQELTTEGGLDAVAGHNHLTPYVKQLVDAGIRVSMFIDPDFAQADASHSMGADVVEIHTGTYCEAVIAGDRREISAELERIKKMATYASSLGLEVHAGHGLTYESVGPVAELPEIVELNIGHFLIGEAIFGGLDSSIRRMRALMDKARAESGGQKSA